MNDSYLDKLSERVVDVYVLLMLCIFPLYARFPFICDIAALFGVEWDGMYFDILGARFGFFWKVTLVFVVLTGVIQLLNWRQKKRKADLERLIHGGDVDRTSLRAKRSNPGRSNPLRTLWQNSTLLDKSFTAFILVNFISMFLSGYPYETWWGNLGRNMGVLTWLMLYLMYLMVTRCYKLKRWHINAFLIAGSLNCLWGITDFFYMDIFHFFEGLDWEFKVKFASSIGNINSYTAFTGILYAFSAGLLVTEEKFCNRVLAFLSMVISLAASIMGLSDNAILSIGAALAAIPILTMRSKDEFKRYVLVVASFFTVLRFCGWLTTLGLNIIAYDFNMGELLKIGRVGILSYVALVFWILYIGLTVMSLPSLRAKRSNPQRSNPSWAKILLYTRRLAIAVLILGLAAVTLILIDANRGGHPELWEPYRGFLIFNDDWGTGRGLSWRIAFQYFIERMPILQKLFGYGPDGYYMITMDNFFEEMAEAGYGTFDTAHSAYINMLLTVGILGLLSYLGIFIGYMKQTVREHSAQIAGLAMMIAYMVQGLINFEVAIVVPSVFILIAMLCTLSNTKEKKLAK